MLSNLLIGGWSPCFVTTYPIGYAIHYFMTRACRGSEGQFVQRRVGGPGPGRLILRVVFLSK